MTFSKIGLVRIRLRFIEKAKGPGPEDQIFGMKYIDRNIIARIEGWCLQQALETEGEWLSGTSAIVAVAAFLAGSPFWNMNGIGELTSVVTGTASAIIYHIRLHHPVCNTEKLELLSSQKN